jgi:hypothetical protein
LWIGLTFRPAVKGSKRVVQRLVSGRMVFGDDALPVQFVLGVRPDRYILPDALNKEFGKRAHELHFDIGTYRSGALP